MKILNKFFKPISLSILFFALSGCDILDFLNGSDKEPSGLTFMTSADDNLLFNYKDNDGNTYDVWGQKDPKGLPSLIEQVTIMSLGDTTQVYYDELGRIIKVFTQGEVLFEFDWISDIEGSVSALTSDGLQQINTNFNLESKSGGEKTQPSSEIPDHKSPTGRISRFGEPIKIKPINTVPHFRESSNPTGNVKVLVNSCNSPSNGENVSVIVKNTTSSPFKSDLLGTFPAKISENGEYYASIPTGIFPSFNPGEYLSSALNSIENICAVNDLPGGGEFSAASIICSNLSAAAILSGVGAVFAPKIFIACETLVLVFEAGCLLNNAVSISNVANSKFLNRKFESDILLYPKVYSALPYQIGPSVIAKPGSSFPLLTVDLGAKTAIRSLKIDPSNPNNGEEYTATADFKCLTSGSIVEISVLGSDGYKDQLSFTISSTTPNSTYQLQVPGADLGVKDNIKLSVKSLGGGEIQRNLSLVFN